MATSPEFQIIDNPYVGPQPFEEKHKAIFFGRTREINDLCSLVVAHGEVLLYAQSGAGKTSLLNAGLIPCLKRKRFRVFSPARVSGQLPIDLKSDDISNLYTFNALRRWVDCHTDSKALSRKSVSDFLDLPEKAVENLDSSEEPTEAGPQKVTQDPGKGGGIGVPKRQAAHTVLIFDQLEEIFEYYPERRGDRKKFFEQIGDALQRDAHLRVIFAIREDYLAQLIPYLSPLPEGMKTRFRLERLQESSALEAITGPLTKLPEPRRCFAPGTAETLVLELLKSRGVNAEGLPVEVPGEYVEPVQLQVVCASLWRSLPSDVQEITQSSLKNFGDVNEALSAFYEDCIQQAVAAVKGLTEGEVRRWFNDTLITAANTRASVYRGPEKTGGLPNAAVDDLEDSHIIRKEQRAGASWYELTHDRFIAPIQRSNQEWRLRRGPALQIKLRLERQAQGWVSSGRARAKLLDGVQLAEAERWLSSPDARELGYSTDLEALVSQSQVEQNAREVEQAESMAASEKLRAEEQHQLAEAQRLLAQKAQDLAEEQRQRAEEKARSAKRLKGLAVSLAVALLLVLVSAFYLYRYWKVANSRELAADAIENLQGDPELGVLLSLQALATTDSTEAEDALHHALESQQVRLTLSSPSPNDHINGLAFSPDGSRLVTADDDKTAKLWDAASGELLLTLSGHKAAVWAVAFSSDGKRLATASEDATAKVWDATSGNPLLTLSGHRTAVRSVAFSPDGRRLSTASEDATAKVWDAASGELLKTLSSPSGRNDAMLAVAFSPDGKCLATGSADKTATVWDPDSGKQLRILSGHNEKIYGAAFSSDGKLLVTASADGTAKFWDVAFDPPASVGMPLAWLRTRALRTLSGPMTRTTRGALAGLTSVAFDPYGDRVATASEDGTAKIWDVASGQMLLTLSGHAGAITGVAFSPYGEEIATAGYDGAVKIWRLNSAGGELFSALHSHDPLRAIAFSRDGGRIATASDDKTAKIWDDSGTELHTLAGHPGEVFDVAFSPDGQRVVTASLGGSVKVWDAASGKNLLTLTATQQLFCVAFSPDGKTLAAGAADGTVRLWDADSGQARRVLAGHGGRVYAIAYSPRGRRFATASADKTAKVWDAESAKELLKLPSHTDEVFDVTFSPDGEHVATASRDGTAKLWDAESGHDLRTFRGHTDAVSGVAFAPDGKHVATASWDNTVRLWDVSSGVEKLTLSWPGSPFMKVAFSPDGKRLGTCNWDGVLRVYAVNLTDLAALAGKAITRTLTDQECKKYLHAKDKCPPGASALQVAERGAGEARAGNLPAAIEDFRHAQEKNAALSFDPQAEAKQIWAGVLVAKARRLAFAGNEAGAREGFRSALALDSTLAFNPDEEARSLAAEGRVAEGKRLVRQGRVKEAMAAYVAARAIDPTLQIDASSLNALCWFGALWGYAREVMPACEEAVKLNNGWNFKDSLGVAKILSGKLEGTCDDFSPLINGPAYQSYRQQRQRWCDTLRQGKNPLTPEEIERLFVN